MIGATKDNMDQHFHAYDKLKGSLTQINDDAVKAIESLSFYEKSKGAKKKSDMRLEKVIEEENEA